MKFTKHKYYDTKLDKHGCLATLTEQGFSVSLDGVQMMFSQPLLNQGYVYLTTFEDETYYIGKRLFRRDFLSNKDYFGSYSKKHKNKKIANKVILGVYENKRSLACAETKLILEHIHNKKCINECINVRVRFPK